MSILALPDFALSSGRPLGAGFVALDLRTFHAAADHVWRLPYGRTSDRSDFRLVLPEARGTCSTKHALLAALAREHGRPVPLVLGIYPMDGVNTPGVAATLRAHGFSSIPEAHCYLHVDGRRVDLTRAGADAGPIEQFLMEEEITPAQIGTYKVELHRRFVRRWAAQCGRGFDEAWAAREACIEALSRTGLHRP